MDVGVKKMEQGQDLLLQGLRSRNMRGVGCFLLAQPEVHQGKAKLSMDLLRKQVF